jgi:predicted outer membrane repeat protein
MSGGTISGNSASSGGGVYVNGAFTMTGGEISGNTARNQGGGVYVEYNGTFTKSGTAGVIYGADASANQWNKADNAGHTVYAGDGKIRDTTARATMALDSKQTGRAGGWE